MKKAWFNASATMMMLVLAGFAAGCLIAQTDEFKVTFGKDGKSAQLTIVRRNVQSDQKEPAKQLDDFKGLIRNWKEDGYILDKCKEGTPLKDRSLSLEDGMLVWRETLLIPDFREFIKKSVVNDTLVIQIGREDLVVETNGTVGNDKGKISVSWPLGKTQELFLKIKKADFKPASDFARRFSEKS